MPGHKPRTNKGLAIAAVLMCLACGVSFTQSSSSHSPITDTQIPDMFVAGNTDDSQIQSSKKYDQDINHFRITFLL